MIFSEHPGIKENDDKFLDIMYEKYILPVQLWTSSKIYRASRNILASRYRDYEDAKNMGDKILKKLSGELPDFLMAFDIPDNISLDVDFYGTTIHYRTALSMASYEGDEEIRDIITRTGINPTVKTVMKNIRPGNELTRMVKIKEGFLNAMELPGPGAQEERRILEESRFWINPEDLRMTLSIGGSTVEEYVEAFHILYDDCPYLGSVDFEINVSCPNTEEGQMLCEMPEGCDTYENLDNLLYEIRDVDGDVPVYVKLSPDCSDDKILELAEICKKHRMGIVLANTKYMETDKLPSGGGGYSGPQNKERAIRLVNLVHEGYKEYDRYKEKEFDTIPIKICGGMETYEDVLRVQNAGGNAVVQIAYTIFSDMFAVPKINRDLSRFCKKHNISSLNEFHELPEEIKDMYPVILN